MKSIRNEKGITLILLIVLVVIFSIIITIFGNIAFSSKAIGKTEENEQKENLIRKIC